MRLSDLVAAADFDEQASLSQLLDKINRTERPYPKDRTVSQIFAERVAEAPASPAVCGGRALSYAALSARADQLAWHLHKLGVAAEQPIAILLPRSAAAIVAMLAALKAGGAYLPLSPDLPRERLHHILGESRPAMVVADPPHADRAWEVMAGAGLKPAVVSVDPSGRLPWPEAIVGPIDRSTPRGLAYVMYTSGTTGTPKGVMVEHQAILRLVVNTNFIELNARDGVLQTGALSFDASTFEVWGALLNGARLILPSDDAWLGARGFAALVRQHRATVVWLTAGVFNALVTEDAAVFAGLRVVLTGGERLSPHHVNLAKNACPDLVLINGYGPTENTTFTTTFEIRQTYDADIPIGRPIANTTVHILDEQREQVPIGVVGELYAGGDGLARGYLNDAELTKARFVPHPFLPGHRIYRTGDLVRWTPEGLIEYLGRADDQVKIRGFRVEPGEIVAALLRHEMVTQVVILAQPSPDGDRRLVAYYTATENVLAAELRRHLRRLLPDYMVPAAFVQLPALPLNANGKVDTAALAMLVAPPTGKRAAVSASDTEAALLAIWRDVLGRPDAGTEDDFFELGGHSMGAVRLVHRIEESFGVLLPFSALFEARTIVELAKLLIDAVRFGDDRIDQPLVKFNAYSRGNPVFAFPPGTADALSYAGLASRLAAHPVYSFNFMAIRNSIEAFADLIEREDPIGPYLLFGYSGGGNFAFRTARELEARGRSVKAIVMIDSSRFVRTFAFPAEEIRLLALEFVDNEGVQHYLTSPALKDKVISTIEAYHRALGDAIDDGTVKASIHLISCEASEDSFRDAHGELVCSKSAWAEATSGAFQSLQGMGDHRRMLHQPHLELNAAMLARIFRDCWG